MKNRKLIIIDSLVIMAMAILLFACRRNEKEITPEIKKLTESVYASGSIISKNEYKVFALADGYLNQKLVEEGDAVTVNQPLFRIESSMQDAKYNSALEAFDVAKENYANQSPVLAELKSSIASAKAKMENDSLNYFRYKNLNDNNAIAKSQYEKALLQYNTSSNDYHSALSRFENTKNQLLLDYKNAQSQLAVNTSDRNNYVLKSFTKGQVYEIFKQPGEAVKRNDLVAIIGDNEHLYIKMDVDEADVSRIQTGQLVYVKIDAESGKIFKASVSKIYPLMNTADQTFRVDAEFTDHYTGKFNGVFVEANIVIGQKENALVIPKSFVIGGDSVMIKEDGDVKQVKITKGIEDFDYVEVIAGLDKNSKLISK